MRKNMMKIYSIGYIKVDTEEQVCATVDRVLAKSKGEALKKFDKHHNGQISDRTIISCFYANY